MPQSATPRFRFPVPAPFSREANFDGGRLTSDGGLSWLAQAETRLGECAAFAASIPEWRRGPVHLSLETLVRQRVFQIACGYEDQDDADFLRTDPLLKPDAIWPVNRPYPGWRTWSIAAPAITSQWRWERWICGSGSGTACRRTW
jgi:hypothetical protein